MPAGTTIEHIRGTNLIRLKCVSSDPAKAAAQANQAAQDLYKIGRESKEGPIFRIVQKAVPANK